MTEREANGSFSILAKCYVAYKACLPCLPASSPVPGRGVGPTLWASLLLAPQWGSPWLEGAHTPCGSPYCLWTSAAHSTIAHRTRLGWRHRERLLSLAQVGMWNQRCWFKQWWQKRASVNKHSMFHQLHRWAWYCWCLVCWLWLWYFYMTMGLWVSFSISEWTLAEAREAPSKINSALLSASGGGLLPPLVFGSET